MQRQFLDAFLLGLNSTNITFWKNIYPCVWWLNCCICNPLCYSVQGWKNAAKTNSKLWLAKVFIWDHWSVDMNDNKTDRRGWFNAIIGGSGSKGGQKIAGWFYMCRKSDWAGIYQGTWRLEAGQSFPIGTSQGLGNLLICVRFSTHKNFEKLHFRRVEGVGLLEGSL